METRLVTQDELVAIPLRIMVDPYHHLQKCITKNLRGDESVLGSLVEDKSFDPFQHKAKAI